MAESAKNEEDLSIEEILDSIRRIISDDVAGDSSALEREPVQPEEVVVAPPPAPPPPPQPEPEPTPPEPEPELEEVLVLTEQVVDEPEEISLDKIVEEEISKQPIQVDMRDVFEAKPEPVKEPEPEPVSFAPEEEGEPLFTEKVESEAYEAISSLARKVALGRGALTLEEIVRQELRPLLRGWLHQNLSSVIDRLVRDELERVSNRVLED